jgi:hypothetical protein
MCRGGGVRAAMRQGSTALSALLTFLAAARGVYAAAPGYEVSLGVAESDNVARVPTDRQSDTLLTQGLGFTWHDLRPRLSADIDADLNYLEYLNHTIGNEVLGNFLGQARATVVPDLLFWKVSDNFGQALTDPLAAATPQNRENINYFDTGPQLIVPLGRTLLLDVTAGYGRVSYQVSPLDSTRYTGGVGLVHPLAPGSSISVNVRDEHVEFSNDTVNPDFQLQEAFGHYEAKSKRTDFSLDLGYSRLRDSLSPASGALARLDISRRISPSSTVALTLGHEYSDSGNAFRLEQTLGGANLNTQTVTQTSTPFRIDHASLAWNFQRSRTGFGIGVDYFKDSYQQPSTLNDNRKEVNVNVSRRLTPTVEVALIGQYFRQQFEVLVGNSTQTIADARLTWRAGQSLSVVFDIERTSRSSDAPGTDFTENRAWVRLAYGRPAAAPVGPVTPPLPGMQLK